MSRSVLVQTAGATKTTKKSEATAGWIPMWHPQGTAKGAGESALESNAPVLGQGQFQIIQFSASRYQARRYSGDRASMEARTFESSGGDFSCKSGVLLLRARDSQGYSDGVMNTMHIETRIWRVVDGSIVYHQRTNSKAEKALFFSKDYVIDDFYLFPQLLP
jgi:hypothetical protein